MTVVESMFSLTVAVTVAAVGTPVAPAAGVDAVTRGAVTAGGVTADDGESADSADTIPDKPFAETAYLYGVSSTRPESMNEVTDTSLTFVPFLKML
jgi:hypothetical protein